MSVIYLFFFRIACTATSMNVHLILYRDNVLTSVVVLHYETCDDEIDVEFVDVVPLSSLS